MSIRHLRGERVASTEEEAVPTRCLCHDTGDKLEPRQERAWRVAQRFQGAALRGTREEDRRERSLPFTSARSGVSWRWRY